eukprot:102520-Rhodomonas_salina.1
MKEGSSGSLSEGAHRRARAGHVPRHGCETPPCASTDSVAASRLSVRHRSCLKSRQSHSAASSPEQRESSRLGPALMPAQSNRPVTPQPSTLPNWMRVCGKRGRAAALSLLACSGFHCDCELPVLICVWGCECTRPGPIRGERRQRPERRDSDMGRQSGGTEAGKGTFLVPREPVGQYRARRRGRAGR